MCKEEIIIKILEKTLIEYPEISTKTLRTILEEELYDYDIQPSERALVPISDIRARIGLYIAAKTLDGLSKLTLKGYYQHLMRFARNIHKNLADINSMDIRMHLAAYTKTGVKPTTINTEITILRAFFKWLEDEDFIQKSPMRKFKNIKTGKQIVKALTVEELETLREACISLRERALIEVYYATGARLSEVYDLNIEDIDWQGIDDKRKQNLHKRKGDDMDRLSELRQVTGYSNEQLEKMTGYTRQGLNKGIKKIHEPLQAKLRIILNRVVEQRISEETAAYEARLQELRHVKDTFRYDYEKPDSKVLQFAKGGVVVDQRLCERILQK